MHVPVIPGRDRASAEPSVGPFPATRFNGIGNKIASATAEAIIWYLYLTALWFGLSLLVDVLVTFATARK